MEPTAVIEPFNKIALRTVFALGAFASLCRYGSDGTLAALGLTHVSTEYRDWFGPISVLAALYFLATFIGWAWNRFGWWKFQRDWARMERRRYKGEPI